MLARRRLDIDVPTLLALLAPIEFRAERRIRFLRRGADEPQRSRDRSVAIAGIVEFGAFDEDRAGGDLGQDRQRVDAWIEDAEITGVPNPFLAGMPAPHVLFPLDRQAAQLRAGESFLGLVHGGVVLGMPG